jgi:ABC-2 type transport system permease protein
MTTVALCWALVTASVRGQMQYRLNFLIEIAFGLVFQSLGFVFIWIVVGRFEALGGWTLSQITLLYGIRLASHGFWTVCFSRLFAIDQIVQQGEYDRMLLRPMPAMLQLMFGSFRIAVLGDLIGGLALLTVGLTIVDIEWTPAKVLFLIASLIGGAMLDGAFQLGPAALTFRYLDSMPLRMVFDNVFTQFGGYPLTIFERKARNLLTFFIPLAFMAWVPATVLLDRTDELPFAAPIAWASPAVGAALLTLAFWLFRRESRHYQSAGS